MVFVNKPHPLGSVAQPYNCHAVRRGELFQHLKDYEMRPRNEFGMTQGSYATDPLASGF